MTIPKRVIGLGALLMSVAWTGTSFAQDPNPATPPAPTAPPSDEKMEEAKKQFDAGVALLDDPDGAKYEEAYRAFKKVYELIQSPKVLGNIGFCAMQLERDGEAIDAYRGYLKEVADIEPRERLQIQRDLQTLTTTAATVRVVAKEQAQAFVLIDRRTQTRGATIQNEYEFEGTQVSVRIRPGRHTLQLRRADGYLSKPLEVTIEPSANNIYELTFPPPPKKEGPLLVVQPSYAGPIALGIVGTALLGTGVVTGLIARNKASDIEKNCQNTICPSTYDLDGTRSSAKTFGTIADITFIGGGVVLAGAAVWYWLMPKGPRTQRVGMASTSWLSSAGCTQHGCGFQLQRGF